MLGSVSFPFFVVPPECVVEAVGLQPPLPLVLDGLVPCAGGSPPFVLPGWGSLSAVACPPARCALLLLPFWGSASAVAVSEDGSSSRLM